MELRALPAAILLAILASACDQAPQGHWRTGPSDIGSLTIEGPTSLVVGETVAFRVIHQTATTTRDVTDAARWHVSQPFLEITGGTATGLGAASVSVWADFDGISSEPLQVRINSRIAGDYTLTIGGGICRWLPLPHEFINRTYKASLAQLGNGLSLQLSDATFEGHAPGTAPVVSGRYDAETDLATFDLAAPALGWWNEGETVWAPVTEVLPDGSRLQIYGTVRAVPVASGLSGTFQGEFVYAPSESSVYRLHNRCESDTHKFTLTR